MTTTDMMIDASEAAFKAQQTAINDYHHAIVIAAATAREKASDAAWEAHKARCAAILAAGKP